MSSYTIELSEPIYQSLRQQADTRHDSLDDFLERLLAIAPFVLPESSNSSDTETLQRELLTLYSTDLEYQELLGLKRLLADFFARKATNEADKLWDEQHLSDGTMDTWLKEG